MKIRRIPNTNAFHGFYFSHANGNIVIDRYRCNRLTFENQKLISATQSIHLKALKAIEST